MRRRADELTALYSTTVELTVAHALPKLLNTIVKRATGLLNAEAGGLYLCEPEHQQVRCADCSGCEVHCPNGVRVAQQLMRAQELFA